MIPSNNQKSRKTKTRTGNRLGLVLNFATLSRVAQMPARMVGQNISSDNLRFNSTEAGWLFAEKSSRIPRTMSSGISDRRSVHGCMLLLFTAFLLLLAAPAQAQNAGRMMAPAQMPETPPTADELAAAQGVEAMFVDMMVQEMRKSVPENELVPVSQGERIFRQMLDTEYSKMITESHSIGLAELVLAQIRGKR